MNSQYEQARRKKVVNPMEVYQWKGKGFFFQ
jgi:hypothetical protein